MYINYSTFVKLYNEAEREKSLDMYVAERGWQDWMGENDASEIAVFLEAIHTIARSDVIELRKMLGTSQIEMIRTFNIPRRTLQSWESGEREMPEHVRKLLSYAVIMEAMNQTDENM